MNTRYCTVQQVSELMYTRFGTLQQVNDPTYTIYCIYCETGKWVCAVSKQDILFTVQQVREFVYTGYCTA